jgi:putative transposase
MIQSIQQSSGHSIRRICQVLQVPRSSHYHAGEDTPSEIRDTELIEIIKVIFRKHKRRYGYRRIVRELSEQGHTCAPARVRRLMKENALIALQPKSYTAAHQVLWKRDLSPEASAPYHAWLKQ